MKTLLAFILLSSPFAQAADLLQPAEWRRFSPFAYDENGRSIEVAVDSEETAMKMSLGKSEISAAFFGSSRRIVQLTETRARPKDADTGTLLKFSDAESARVFLRFLLGESEKMKFFTRAYAKPPFNPDVVYVSSSFGKFRKLSEVLPKVKRKYELENGEYFGVLGSLRQALDWMSQRGTYSMKPKAQHPTVQPETSLYMDGRITAERNPDVLKLPYNRPAQEDEIRRQTSGSDSAQ